MLASAGHPGQADVVVIGGGTSGAALAGLLIERSELTVTVIDAGPDYGDAGSGRWPAEVAPLLAEPMNDLAATADSSDDLIRANVSHYWHPVGTCAMGTDPDNGHVVDPDGRLYGCDNVWIIDASIIPRTTRSTPNLTVVALAEAFADTLVRSLA